MTGGWTLGRRSSRRDTRTLSFGSYARASIPPAPPIVDWGNGVAFVEPYRNREIGICAFASAAHAITVWNARNGRDVVPTQFQVELAYADVGGFVASDPATWNNGADMLSVANYWRRTGIGGHKIRAFLKLDPRNIEQLRIAAWLFGPLYVGASLPLRAQRQPFGWMLTYKTDSSDNVGSWGGHAMACPRVHHTGGEFFTWGVRMPFTWSWWTKYVDEVYCLLSDEWADADGTPNGFDFATLERDMRAIGAL